MPKYVSLMEARTGGLESYFEGVRLTEVAGKVVVDKEEDVSSIQAIKCEVHGRSLRHTFAGDVQGIYVCPVRGCKTRVERTLVGGRT